MNRIPQKIMPFLVSNCYHCNCRLTSTFKQGKLSRAPLREFFVKLTDERPCTAEFLGLFIDDELSWRKNVDQISAKTVENHSDYVIYRQALNQSCWNRFSFRIASAFQLSNKATFIPFIETKRWMNRIPQKIIPLSVSIKRLWLLVFDRDLTTAVWLGEFAYLILLNSLMNVRTQPNFLVYI